MTSCVLVSLDSSQEEIGHDCEHISSVLSIDLFLELFQAYFGQHFDSLNILGDFNIYFEQLKSVSKVLNLLHMFKLIQRVDTQTHRCDHIVDWVPQRANVDILYQQNMFPITLHLTTSQSPSSLTCHYIGLHLLPYANGIYVQLTIPDSDTISGYILTIQ